MKKRIINCYCNRVPDFVFPLNNFVHRFQNSCGTRHACSMCVSLQLNILIFYLLLSLCIFVSVLPINSLFKSNERSELRCLVWNNERCNERCLRGKKQILLIFFSGKSLKILMHLCIYALFEFNWISSAENDVNSTIQIRRGNGAKKKRERFLASKVEFNYQVSQRNKN